MARQERATFSRIGAVGSSSESLSEGHRFESDIRNPFKEKEAMETKGIDRTPIESKVAAAILEKNVGELEIDGRTYAIAPPSIATLILVSEEVAKLPIVERVGSDKMPYHVLHYAKDFSALGKIFATLILGAKEVLLAKRSPWYRITHIGRKKQSKCEELAELILNNVRPSILFDILVKRLLDMEISSFFAITTSLSEANILRPTKEVVR